MQRQPLQRLPGLLRPVGHLEALDNAIHQMRRLQQTAQLIQSPDHPAWWENVEDWIESLRRECPGDIARLKRWLLLSLSAASLRCRFRHKRR